MGKAKSKVSADVPKSNRSIASDSKDMKSLKQENEILTKNNKLLAQKVAELEHNRIIQRKASFISGAESQRSGTGTPMRDNNTKNADLSKIFYQGASSPD